MVLEAMQFLFVIVAGLVWKILFGVHAIASPRYLATDAHSDCQNISTYRLDVIDYVLDETNPSEFYIPTKPQYFWYHVVNSSIPILKRTIFPTYNSNHTNIVEIKMPNAKITKIEDAVFDKFYALECVDLSGNKLSHIDENAFGTILRLRYLDLSSNFITNLEPSSFRGLTGLNILNLSSNSLSNLKSEIFTGLSNLKQLDLSENPINTINTNLYFEPLVALEKLYLRDIANNNNLFNFFYLTNLLQCYKHLQTVFLSDDELRNCSHASSNDVYFVTSSSNQSARHFNTLCRYENMSSQLKKIGGALDTIVSQISDLNNLTRSERTKSNLDETLKAQLTLSYILMMFVIIITLILSAFFYKIYIYKYLKLKIRKANGGCGEEVML